MDQDTGLIQRALEGDSSAFDQLVEPHLPRCYRIAYLIAHNESDAGDALQEALIRAFRSLGNVTPGRPFSPWFVRIVVTEALKLSQRKRKVLALPLHERLSQESAEQVVLAQEERARVWEAVQELSPDHRTVVVLRYYEGLSEREMAELLAVSPGTIKSRLHHARSAIEQKLSRRSPRRSLFNRLNPFAQGGRQHD